MADTHLVDALIRAATLRADAQDKRADGHDADVSDLRLGANALESRLRAVETALAEARGAAGLWGRAPAWIALVVSAFLALHTFKLL